MHITGLQLPGVRPTPSRWPRSFAYSYRTAAFRRGRPFRHDSAARACSSSRRNDEPHDGRSHRPRGEAHLARTSSPPASRRGRNWKALPPRILLPLPRANSHSCRHPHQPRPLPFAPSPQARSRPSQELLDTYRVPIRPLRHPERVQRLVGHAEQKRFRRTSSLLGLSIPFLTQ